MKPHGPVSERFMRHYYGASKGKQQKPTDAQLLDALEREIRDMPLMLWDGEGEFPGGPRGLSLIGGKSLREALAIFMVKEPAQ